MRWLVVMFLSVVIATGLEHGAHAAEPLWQAGVARVVITPDQPMWMSGYGGRDHAAEGKIHDLYARVAAFQDPQGSKAVFVSLDLVGVPGQMVSEISADIEKRHQIPRRSLMVDCSHTHCGPALDDRLSYMLAMKDEDWAQVRAYQKILTAKITGAIDAAIKDLQPAKLSTGQGTCGFASNRRQPIGTGPYDHSVPVLRIESPAGDLRGLIFGYACHNTVLGFYQFCGDYAGFAQLYLEDRHPGAVAMFFIGCGADQNPLPRRTLERAEKYGRMLGVAVDDVLDRGTMKPVTGRLRTAFEQIELAFHAVPPREFFENALKSSSAFEQRRAKLLLREWDRDGALPSGWPYPVQAWQLGDHLTWVALGGEVVIDYQLRLKKELGADRTWVTGYANDVMGYIPSERVLTEGGYEGDTSMIVYQLPSKWKAGLENQIVDTVHRLIRDAQP